MELTRTVYKIEWILLLFFVLNCIHVNGQCSGKRCGECIVSGPDCLWCKQKNYNETRCAVLATLTSNGCSSGDIVRHPVPSITKIKDKPLQDGGVGVEPIQLQPQEVKIRLVPNKLFRWTFKYRVAQNFPVDIYFLVDPSYTMRNLRTQLADLADDIGTSIRNLTTDFRFGYGTSMDKVTLPYTHTTPEYLQNPCPGDPNLICAPPHSFLHRLNLTNDVQAFRAVVRNTQTTANRDKTEGLLDGVMQVAVCGDKIGWRNKARRMLIYASDVDYHFAGDGKLAGIVRPHDLQCHLAPEGPNMKYTHDTILDYPSIGQIRKAITDNNINVIFVIDNREGYKNYYVKLNPDIPGSFTEELSQDATNILSIIRTTYEKLRGTVNFVNDAFQNIDTQYWSACGGRISQTDQRSTCSNITVGLPIDFEFRMTLNINKCPDNINERTVRSSIHPEGLEDRLDVNVEYICDCDCQAPGQAVENSTDCNRQGRLECGVCHCNDGWSGDKCDCDISKTQEETCGQTTDGVNYIICSNVGECQCGKCVCPDDYTGEYCECYNKGCGGYIGTGELCNGNGMCQCSSCVCNEGYNGTTCDCPTATDSCTNNNGTTCSDRGQCVCGKCVCDDNNYRGDQCQECPTCPGQCKANQDCAECVGFKQGKLSESDCAAQCIHVSTDAVLPVENITKCQFFDEEGCQIEFTYEYDEQFELKVVVKDTKTCPPGPPDATTLALGVSGAIFLVGLLLLLIWKLLTSCLDGMEYKKFATEINDPKWGFEKNPIYKDCITEVQNPMCDIPKGPDGPGAEGMDSVVFRKK
ncbi:integrin beta-1-A-like isoform X1 [Mytilus trossulus]|uniref:integrin beta-1-A-like isoform X1 n=1 Tax=Mytilus trossulus TaxID=6551 RepID=UPI003004B259